MALIYKICEAAEWAVALSAGSYAGSDVDRKDGFIHFSTAAQTAETARKHFAGRRNLVLLAFEDTSLEPNLRYAPARGGQLFPHLYGPLDPRRALWLKSLASGSDGIPIIPGSSAVSLYPLLRPFLFALDAETAHIASLRALRTGLMPAAPAPDRRLRQRLLGLEFASPVGLAAGYDKNAEVFQACSRMGFAFAEVGGVTPRPQAGNARPRLFRLTPDEAVINRMGFNNDGFDRVHARLALRPAGEGGIVGVNVGANKDSADRADDFAAGIARFDDVADYIAVNISSPNTPGLRDLQERTALEALLSRVAAARAAAPRRVPVLVKLAPDLDDDALAAAIDTAGAAGIDGIILANTTLTREGLRDPQAKEAGGMSGRPLFRRTTVMLAKARLRVGKAMVLIGAGGVDSAETAWEKLLAGADLVQLYTGLIYRGPHLPAEIASGLAARLDRERIASIDDIVGTAAERWAAVTP